jgi:hypothetical protein
MGDKKLFRSIIGILTFISFLVTELESLTGDEIQMQKG